MTIVVNFFGGPGAGKSTMAARLFGWMKAERMNVEYVSEFAKDLTWRKSNCIDDQLYILGEQQHRLYTLRDQVDYIITDSPLLLGIHYLYIGNNKFSNHVEFEEYQSCLKHMIWQAFDMYDNINFEVHRGVRKFVQEGRNQDEETAKLYDENINVMLNDLGVDFRQVTSLDDVLQHMGLKDKVGMKC